MMRITNSDLEGAVARLNSITHHTQAFRYEPVKEHPGGYRIVRDGGKQQVWWTVSPTLGTKRELFLWIDAYTYGIYDGQTILMGGWECGRERVQEGGQ
jgi:hypothetical protein